MEQRIQLQHPTGKKAVTMNKVKYDVLKEEIMKHLQTNGASTHDEILASINGHFKKHKIKFEGAVGWAYGMGKT